MANESPREPYEPLGGGGVTEVISQLSNIARQMSVWSQSVANATPAATTTTSPRYSVDHEQCCDLDQRYSPWDTVP